MDEKYTKLLLCFEKIKTQLRSISARKSGNHNIKKRKIRPGAQRKYLIFENNMKCLRSDLGILYEIIFKDHCRPRSGVYLQISREILRTLVSTSLEYEVTDDALSFTTKCLVAPIVSQIMNVMENNRGTEEMQKKRQSFILSLLTIKMPTTERSSDDESIDVIDLTGDGDTELPKKQVRTNQRPFGVTIVTPHILNVLFDAIDKHIGNCEHKESYLYFVRAYYHNIMNVFRLTKILRKYFEKLRNQLNEDDKNKPNQTPIVELIRKCVPGYLERVNNYQDRMVNVTQFELMRMELSRISYTLAQILEKEK